ncbi:MAG: hypothetical protein FWH22_04425 [Fibromonadales bacterium]|nr:hypothetical protein [Fibromonadales bacterium]
MRKSSLLIVMFASLFFACGEVGVSELDGNPPVSSSSSGGLANSSSSGNGDTPSSNSTSSNSNAVCGLGQSCCNGAEYDSAISFCHEDQLYPRCGAQNEYDPYQFGCFGGQLYPRCEIESTRGTCVHNTLLRCRQEGEGEEYIRDPFPGMECQPNGAITGKKLDLRINRIYETVQIGGQIWLAENLDWIPVMADYDNSQCHDNNSINCEKYGRLYDWATALGLGAGCNGTRQGCDQPAGLRGGICPVGFGVPKTSDWKTLIDYAGGSNIAGGRLKSKTDWSHNGVGTDNYNFNALSGGYAFDIGLNFGGEGSSSYWWTDTQYESEADYVSVIASDTEARNNFWSKGLYMAYVRCVHYY